MPTGQPSVLIVDDTEANLVALEAQLRNMQCDLVRASSGNEALRLLLKSDFAVMLLDVQMPDMDGFEVARHARSNPATRNVPIIFVTAMLGSEENMLRGYDTGAVDFLLKPINPYILKSKVDVFLELYLGRQKLASEVEAHKRTLAELESFNSFVSHDLRSPLRPLDGFSQVLLSEYGPQLDDRGRHYLERIRAGAQRMNQLIEDLLRLSRITRSGIERKSIDLSEVAQSIMTEVRGSDVTRVANLTFPPEARAYADPKLARIALENLLRNAWKFTQRRTETEIAFGTSVINGECVFFVRDNGAGFDQKNSDRLFRPFTRLHTNAEFEGTGIGLAIVNRIILAHGGRIWAESKVAEGTTFFFTLGPA